MVQKQGVFITFEGIEGAGKSTQIRLLAEKLKEFGARVSLTREPGGTLLGDEIRNILVDNRFKGMNALTELFLFQAARVEHLTQIILPSLQSGYIVLSDRFTDATVAYQGYGRGLPIDEVERLNILAVSGVVPNKTILLDVLPATGISRVIKRFNDGAGEKNRLDEEKSSFYERVRDGYLTLANLEPDRFIIIDASGDESSVSQEVWDACMDLFKEKGIL